MICVTRSLFTRPFSVAIISRELVCAFVGIAPYSCLCEELTPVTCSSITSSALDSSGYSPAADAFFSSSYFCCLIECVCFCLFVFRKERLLAAQCPPSPPPANWLVGWSGFAQLSGSQIIYLDFTVCMKFKQFKYYLFQQ